MARRRKASDAPACASVHVIQSIPTGRTVDRNVLMPGYRVRHDGWTAERTQRFLDTLAHTGCVRDAARVAGISNTAGYRLKRRFPKFAAAWDEALARAQQGLIAVAYKRAVEGRETVIIRKGEEHERRIEPSDAMLGLLIKRGDMDASRPPPAPAIPPEDVLTRAEWEDNWTFNPWTPGKYQRPDPAGAGARLEAKYRLMKERLYAQPCCESCGQPLIPSVKSASIAELVALGHLSDEETTATHIEAEEGEETAMLYRALAGLPFRPGEV